MKSLGKHVVHAAVAALSATVMATPASQAITPTTPARTAGSAEPERVLGDNLSGDAAVRALGGQLAEVARQNRTSGTELAALLREDRTLWLDRTGRLHVKDPIPEDTGSTGPGAGSGTTAAPEVAAGPFPNSDTFSLHSRPGASRVVFLDFDGHAVSGTAWNSSYGLPTTAQPAFDLDGSPATWSQAEHDTIQSVYQRVAEDFAPFDVDVTTADPGADAIARTGSTDTQFGTRVLVTPSTDAATRICSNSCGGVAYIGVYNISGSATYHPAWVFPQLLGNSAKNIAEAATHEAGHNLGLQHDGTATAGYYSGHSNWAPIMGSGYNEPVVQWSSGEYTGANNTQDDLAVMATYGLPPRPDDHGETTAAATAVGAAASTTGVVGTRSDVDVVSITRSCASSATATVTPASTSPNLDARLRLLDATGAVVAEADPASGEASFDVASGLSASVTASLQPGTYYLEVQGVGVRTPSTGYSDYASLGAYTVAINPCESDTTPPTVTTRSPAPGSTGVPAGSDVVVTFDEPVTGVDGTTLTLRSPEGALVQATVGYDATLRQARLNPAADLIGGATFTAALSGGPTAIRDEAGNPLASTSWTFTTVAPDTVAPRVSTRSPASGAVGVARGSNVAVTFSEAVRGVTTTSFVLRNTQTGAAIGATVSLSTTANRWVLNPNVTLAARTQYTVTLLGGPNTIRDTADNPLTTTRWSFTTGS